MGFCKKDKYNNIIYNWQMMFQALNLKGNHFLELLDDKCLLVNPTYMKDSFWLK